MEPIKLSQSGPNILNLLFESGDGGCRVATYLELHSFNYGAMHFLFVCEGRVAKYIMLLY